jgi:hypothetical protein
MKANKKQLYESIMASVAKEVKKVLNETKSPRQRRLNESEDEYEYLRDDYSNNDVRRLARQYLEEYYEELPEEEGEYPNWGEISGGEYEDLQDAWMYGDNWAADIADEEREKFFKERGWD